MPDTPFLPVGFLLILPSRAASLGWTHNHLDPKGYGNALRLCATVHQSRQGRHSLGHRGSAGITIMR